MNILSALFWMLWLLWIVMILVVAAPVLMMVAIACAVYEALRGLWWGWQWLKEVGK